MRIKTRCFSILVVAVLLFPALAPAQSLSLKEIQARVLEYKNWLDQLAGTGSPYWVRLDSTRRPHRLYVGEAFLKADPTQKEQFVEIFSRYLAGHPEKNMLIDIFDASTDRAIGEYGFGGFKLF